MLPEANRAEVRAGEPFASNHQIFLGVQGGYSRCRAVADHLKGKILEKGYRVNGADLAVVVETSRAQCKLFYEACRALAAAGVKDEDILCCQKGLRVYDARTQEPLGCCRGSNWAWLQSVDSLGVPNLRTRLEDQSI